jgi:general secretion pathway protein I
LAILAIALAAAMRSTGQAIATSTALRERTIALWVAQDRLARHRLARDWPTPDTTDGESDMAGRTWRWREQVITTPEANLRRIEIEIRGPKHPDVLAKLVGLLERPS